MDVQYSTLSGVAVPHLQDGVCTDNPHLRCLQTIHEGHGMSTFNFIPKEFGKKKRALPKGTTVTLPEPIKQGCVPFKVEVRDCTFHYTSKTQGFLKAVKQLWRRK